MECIGSLFAFIVLFSFGLAMASREERRKKEEWANLIDIMERGAYAEGYEEGYNAKDAQYADGTCCAGCDEEDVTIL
jgi:hypothetical protein